MAERYSEELIDFMTTNELLACVTPGANDYIQTTISTKNKADYQKLKKLFDEQRFEAKSFEDSDLDILNFDWQSLERDRNWWWQLQALPFLNWYANSFSLQSDEERTRYLSLCLDAIHNWVNQAKQNKASPLVWHDHAAAFRVRNLTNWLVFCHSSGLPLGEEPSAELLGSLIIEHLDWLQEDKHYSKHTNHGFDQAMIALTIASMFASDAFEAYRQRNRERLEDEVTFAFTDEGVHKENSPGYQKMMLGRLKQLRTLAPLGELDVSQMGERYIEKAEAFLRAITLPNGYLPMIGDTRGEDKGLPYEQKEQVDVLDYSASGYVIVRGEVLEKDFHLVFKASHLSHYHRHDDDLSIHLYYNGKHLLGDGGLGSHNEKDKKRKALRSYLSHNAPYLVDGKAARKVAELDGALPTVSLQDEKIVGKSFCYGAELTREIDISQLQDGKLVIRDSVDECSGQPFAINFFSSEGLYEDGESLLVSVSGNKALRISASSPINSKNKSTYISKEFSKFSGAAAVTLSHGDKGASAIEFEVDINHPKQVLHEVVYRGFGPIELLEAGDWFFDNDYPGNVCHHVMSLRWLGEVKSPSIKARILRSFIAYHGSSEKRHSRYYLGRTADHTTSIRLAELLAEMNGKKTDANLRSLLRRELAKNIRSCLKDTYKENNNHGLMVDKAILLCLIKDKWLLEKFGPEVSFVISRVEKQLNGIFDEEGYCKEHSTSYQEYNLGIALDLLDVMESGRGLGFDVHIDELKSRVEKIKVASRKALGFLLKDDGTYVTVGDSFPQPKPDILEKAFGSRDPKTALLPESEQHGVFYNKTLGVSVYRDSNVHLVLNASWHSYVHKQNDDLNLFLRIDGEDVLAEGGYSDIIPLGQVDTRSESLHSTIIPLGKIWISRGSVGEAYSHLMPPEVFDNGSIQLIGCHTRVGGKFLRREVLISHRKIIINDISDYSDVIHRFVIPSYFNINDERKNTIKLSSRKVEASISVGEEKSLAWGGWNVVSSKIIADNKEANCTLLDYSSNGRVRFEISF